VSGVSGNFTEIDFLIGILVSKIHDILPLIPIAAIAHTQWQFSSLLWSMTMDKSGKSLN
jgi:transposase